MIDSPKNTNHAISRLEWIALAGLLAAAGSLRFWGLGRFGLWVDEYFHVYAAMSVLERGEPFVLGHGLYWRSLPTTLITALSFKLFGVTEWSARAPFVAINLAFVLMGFVILKRWLSPFTAWVFAVVMSFSPFCIEVSRSCRMYGLFQLLYFATAYVAWTSFESAPTQPRRWVPSSWYGIERRFQIDAGGLVLAALLFGMAAFVHLLAFNFVFVVASYLFVMTLWMGSRDGWTAAFQSKYAVSLAVIVVVSGAVLLIAPDLIGRTVRAAADLPVWYKPAPAGHRFYRYFLTSEYPALFWLYPLGAFLLVRQRGKKGLFIVLSFAFLFAMHSYIFDRKTTRYIFYIFPFFVLGSAAALEVILPAALRSLRQIFPERGAAVTAIAWLSLIPAVNVVGYPWLGNSKGAWRHYPAIDWKNVTSDVRAWSMKRPVIHSNALACHRYNGFYPDFTLPGEEKVTADETHLLTNVEDFKAVLNRHPDITVVTDRGRLNTPGYFDKNMTELLRARLKRIAHSGDERIEIYSGRRN